MEQELENKYISPEIKYAFEASIKALENQIFFENTVEEIRDWFVGNKDCLLDSAMKVARDGFIENSTDYFIDEVELDFIVEDIVDEIQEGILNVLDTFKGVYKERVEDGYEK